ncbi:MAG: tetratricopeptide repeat protein, partial [Flavobacteriales bacterium]
MMRVRKLIILLAWALTGLTAQAQPTTDEQLAAHYFQAGEFDKAMLYYEKLYNKKPGDFYYGYYLKCLMQLEDYKGAEKLIKKQINRAGEKGKYRVDLGLVYNSSGRKEKAQQQYQRAIREMQPNQSAITGLSRSFMAVGEFDFALETLQRGRKLMRGYYPFNVEIAGVYAAMGDYKSMIDEYLDLLNINENYLQSVQNALNRYLSFEKKSEQNDLLKAQLLRRIQRNPGRSVFSEMLIWIYVQQKDFEHAFVQA